MYKYEQMLTSLGLTAQQVGPGVRDKIKKFLKAVNESENLTAKLKTNISEEQKQAIRDELNDIDIAAADERLANSVEKWYTNKDLYVDRVNKMAAAREAKKAGNGGTGTAKSQPQNNPPAQPPAQPQNNPPAQPPVPAGNEDLQEPVVPEPEEKKNKGLEVAGLIVAGIVLVFTGIWLKKRS